AFGGGRDVPTLAAAIDGWQRSHHMGSVGERLTTVAEVTLCLPQEPRTYRGRSQVRYLLRLRSTRGRVLIWPARPRSGAVPATGAAITITGTVAAHDWYGDTAQTYITRCTWENTPTHP
ncbi:hypothetical protein ABZ369_13375, partial [Streptomyces sp. NPDC005918]